MNIPSAFSQPKKHIIIIGAGPGGLTSAMILANKGYRVTILEKKDRVGGRNAALTLGEYTFELGPTFVMLPDVFKQTFTEAGKDMQKYLALQPLDLMYRLQYADGRKLHVHFDKQKFKSEIQRLFPGEATAFDRFMQQQKKTFDRLYQCLTIPYMYWYNYLRLKMLKAVPVLGLGKSVHDVLSSYFKDEDFKIAMAFQAKYLGMSPWTCPGGFTILSYVEHAEGIHHPIGGVHKISEALAQAAQDDGAIIQLNTSVKEILFGGDMKNNSATLSASIATTKRAAKKNVATGVLLEDGTVLEADAIIMNADFAYGMSQLVSEKTRQTYSKKYSDAKLAKKGYSCSTFMIYLGLKKKYDIPHHNIVFSGNYKKNVDEIYTTYTLPEDPSFYIQNASVTDPSLAPEGKSTIYVLVPVSNLDANIDWEKEKKGFRDLIIKKIATQTELTDIEDQIEVEQIITPLDWEQKAHVYKGAVFNLAHSLDQMLYLRPHNKLEGYNNLYLVGGGTHPGSGLPTIVESGRITARIIEEEI
jgi:phytoene desaturase